MSKGLTKRSPEARSMGNRRGCASHPAGCGSLGKSDPPTPSAALAAVANSESSDNVDLMFRAFSDRTRLRILHLLSNGELCVGDIAAILQVPQPRASRHLGHLRKARLVTVRKSGLWSFYSLARAATPFHEKLMECLAGCFHDVPELQADSARAAQIRKSGGCCPPQ